MPKPTEEHDHTLESLYHEYTAKFDEICAFLAVQYGDDPDPAKLPAARREQIATEAGELIDDWKHDALDNWDLEFKPQAGVQQLLAEYHAIGERILDRQNEILCKRGWLRDDED